MMHRLSFALVLEYDVVPSYGGVPNFMFPWEEHSLGKAIVTREVFWLLLRLRGPQ